MGKKGSPSKAFQDQTTKLRCAVAALISGAIFVALHLGQGLSGVEPHLLVKGPDGCYPLPAQLSSHAPVSGGYDFMLVSRAVINGLCAVDPARPVCATHTLVADDVTTTVQGFHGIRNSCHAEGSEGYHFPQHCAATTLNSTAFGMLAAQGPDRDACESKHRWPAAFCDRLAALQAAWPYVAPQHNTPSGGVSTATAAVGSASSVAWSNAWARYGSCTNMHPEEYFDAALSALAALLAHDKLDEKKLGPAWPAPSSNHGVGPFEKPFTLKLLGERFGGAYAAGLHCERAPDGRTYLTEVKQCVRPAAGKRGDGREGGQFQPTTCPRWVLDADKSCRPDRSSGKAGFGGTQIWLGRPPSTER